MAFLFWALWIFNLLLLLLTMLGKEYRSSFGAGVDLNVFFIGFLLIILVVSLFLRFSAKPKWISLAVVCIPVVIMILWYAYEKISGKTLV